MVSHIIVVVSMERCLEFTPLDRSRKDRSTTDMLWTRNRRDQAVRINLCIEGHSPLTEREEPWPRGWLISNKRQDILSLGWPKPDYWPINHISAQYS